MVRTVAPHLVGRRIVSARFTSRFVTPGNRATLAAKLAGRKIESVTRRGKFIVIGLDAGVLSIHLGMTGRLLVSGREGEHTYGVFVLDDGQLLYDDPRQFGKIEWNPKRVAALGPEALEITFEEFRTRLRGRGRIKPLLLNQAFLAGLGNIYADESLFAAGIHPLASAGKLSAPRTARLHQAIREILTEAIAAGGSSISDYVDAEGRRGWFQARRARYAGPRCGRLWWRSGGRTFVRGARSAKNFATNEHE